MFSDWEARARTWRAQGMAIFFSAGRGGFGPCREHAIPCGAWPGRLSHGRQHLGEAVERCLACEAVVNKEHRDT